MEHSGFAEEKVDGDPPEFPLNPDLFQDLLEILFTFCFTRIIRHHRTRPPGRLDPDAGDQSWTVVSIVSRPGQGVAAQLTRSLLLEPVRHSPITQARRGCIAPGSLGDHANCTNTQPARR
jgi:hypothetical protein